MRHEDNLIPPCSHCTHVVPWEGIVHTGTTDDKLSMKNTKHHLKFIAIPEHYCLLVEITKLAEERIRNEAIRDKLYNNFCHTYRLLSAHIKMAILSFHSFTE
jgi:hypothetical protein